MIGIMKTVEDKLVTLDNDFEKGCWINLVNPSEDEILDICKRTGILPSFIQSALDEEERSHIETEDGQVLLLVNIPFVQEENNSIFFDTIPLGIIITSDAIVTVCLQDNPIVSGFAKGMDKSFYTFKKSRFILQMLYRTSTTYLRFLKQIYRKINLIEGQLRESTRNEAIFRLLELEKSLVYFTTSLRSNEVVMEKLMRPRLRGLDPDAEAASRVLRFYPEDEELLEDVITENKQAIEMAGIYSNLLSGLMDAFTSIISNNLNIVMRFLTSVTIIVALPTMVYSFFGMNVGLPIQHNPYAALWIVGISVLVSMAATMVLWRRRML